MNTEQRDELLFDYWEGNLSPEKATWVERQCQQDPEWEKALADWEKALLPEEPLERPAFLDSLKKSDRKGLAWVYGLTLTAAASLALLFLARKSEPTLNLPVPSSPVISQVDTSKVADSSFVLDLSGLFPMAWNSPFYNHWMPTCGGVIYSDGYGSYGFPFPYPMPFSEATQNQVDSVRVELVFEQPSNKTPADSLKAPKRLQRLAQWKQKASTKWKNWAFNPLRNKPRLQMARYDLRAWIKGEDKPQLRLVTLPHENSKLPSIAVQFHSASLDLQRNLYTSHE
jgi:hypothetical protein